MCFLFSNKYNNPCVNVHAPISIKALSVLFEHYGNQNGKKLEFWPFLVQNGLASRHDFCLD